MDSASSHNLARSYACMWQSSGCAAKPRRSASHTQTVGKDKNEAEASSNTLREAACETLVTKPMFEVHTRSAGSSPDLGHRRPESAPEHRNIVCLHAPSAQFCAAKFGLIDFGRPWTIPVVDVLWRAIPQTHPTVLDNHSHFPRVGLPDIPNPSKWGINNCQQDPRSTSIWPILAQPEKTYSLRIRPPPEARSAPSVLSAETASAMIPNNCKLRATGPDPRRRGGQAATQALASWAESGQLFVERSLTLVDSDQTLLELGPWLIEPKPTAAEAVPELSKSGPR